MIHDQSVGTEIVTGLILATAVICGLILWLERVFAESHARHNRNVERRIRRYERCADYLGREAAELAYQGQKAWADLANDCAREWRVKVEKLKEGG